LSAELNTTTLTALDSLVNQITKDNNTAIIDIHNYARWYCSIINQPVNSAYINPGGVNVTDADFADLWTRLAKHYQHNPRVQFQLMNEPHDLNITTWSATLQNAVYAIRNVTSIQPILVSGTSFARLSDWPNFSRHAMLNIHDSANNLLFDFHQYFDDLGGAYGPCSLPWSSYEPLFQNVTDTLRAAGQRGILTEFGSVPTPNCVEIMAGLLEFLEDNQDIWFGWTAWGSFLTGDPRELSTNQSSVQYTLTKVLTEFAPKL
jgi:endoglucanase